MSYLATVEPDDRCGRCDHPSKFHASAEYGSECRIVGERYWRGETLAKGMRAKKCLCDGFFPAERT